MREVGFEVGGPPAETESGAAASHCLVPEREREAEGRVSFSH